jgi:hypothetical protein
MKIYALGIGFGKKTNGLILGAQSGSRTLQIV